LYGFWFVDCAGARKPANSKTAVVRIVYRRIEFILEPS
jgi:hypothetical protein